MNEHQKASCFNSANTSFFKFNSTNVNLLFCLVCLSDKNYVMIGQITCESNSLRRVIYGPFGYCGACDVSLAKNKNKCIWPPLEQDIDKSFYIISPLAMLTGRLTVDTFYTRHQHHLAKEAQFLLYSMHFSYSWQQDKWKSERTIALMWWV